MWKPYQFLCPFFFFLFFQANLSLSTSPTTQLCSHDEATALIQFNNSFSFFSPYDRYSYRYCDSSIPKTDSWKEGTNCCSWDGVTCDNEKGQVIGLDLSCSQLHGTITSNSSLFRLPHLQKLNLAFNDFNNSKMSSAFGRFASLMYLNLSNANFAEEVPSQLSHLSKLVSLDLSGNYLQTIEEHTLKALVQNLTEVRQLVFDTINMSSINPNVLMNLSSSLRSLSLSDCDLRGKFPKNIFEGNLSQLRYLDLSTNRFSGQLPSSLTNLTQLEVLDISDHFLEGSIPDEVTAFPNLISLFLNSNLLNGTLPSWLYAASSLKYIYLYENQLSGQIKEFHCKSVEEIYFRGNKLEGPIPSSISQLVNLTHLDLSSNNLSGTLEFGMFSKLQNLQYLDVSQNSPSLNCNGTSADFTLPNLHSLHLSSCNINEFPQFLRGSKRLQYLDLSNNRISGNIPKWMWDVGKDSLSYLNLSHNSLTTVEQLPWKEISVLDLSSNLIQGDLPIPPTETDVFFISNNSLTGEISSQICNASYLKILDLSHNNLSGIIPQCFGNLSKSVLMLNLQKNKLYGIIPPTFAKECQLRNLNLNGNQLQGSLTRSISNCRDLELLDLGNNKISDTFPHWLGSLPQLQVLVLQSNQFHGSIRDTRSNHSFPKIQIFDLSNNSFSGPLPVSYIRNFKAMINHTGGESGISYMGLDSGAGFYSYSIVITMKGLEMDLVKIFTMLTSIDLSNNKFEGEIPKVIGKLNSLKGLNLSHNNLTGSIPISTGNLINLEWLDLSWNKLVGTIPERLLDLTFLSFFNVSENQLGGRIPQGKQFSTFGKDSYEGNKGLCGFPVSKGCSINEPPPPQLSPSNLPEKANFDFGWKVVLIGYGCGVIFGLAVGYVVFQTGKPIWFVSLVEDQYLKRRRKSKIGNRCSGARRN